MAVSSETGVAIITGGTRGIGRAIALELARAGSDVALTFRSDEVHAEAARREIEAIGRRALVVRSDVADAAQAAAGAAAPPETPGGPSAVCDTPGVPPDRVPSSL